MSEWNLLIRAIDVNSDNKINSKQEVQKAKSLGIEANEGDDVSKLIEKSSKINLQEALQKIDQSQTVDNKNQENDYMKKKRFMALG